MAALPHLPRVGVEIPFPPGCQAGREDPKINLRAPLEQKGSFLFPLSPPQGISQGGETRNTGFHPLPNFSPGKEGIRLHFSFRPLSGGDFLARGARGGPRSSPRGEGRVPHTGRAALICSSQPGRPSGPYLGPQEKIKADKGLARSAPREKLSGGKREEITP